MKKLLALTLVLALALGAAPALAQSAKDTLVVSAITSSESLDPHTANEFDRMVCNQVLDTLFMYDENGEPSPGLAQSWEDDGLVITVKLRQGVSFHDGTPFNADAVLKNYAYELAGEYAAMFPTYVSAIDKIDDYTIAITKATPYASVLDYCCSYFYMSSPTAYEADPAARATHPVGTGAYVFDHRDPATGYTYLTANEDYFGGAPYFKKLEVRTVLDSTTALIALENGELDLFLNPTPSDFAIAQETPSLRAESTDGWNKMTAMTYGEPYISDIALRKAIFYAINRENAALYYDMEDPILDGDLFAAAIMGEYAGMVPTEGYDPEMAKEWLAKSGYQGQTLEINVQTGLDDLAVSLQYDLEAVGIKATVNVMDPATWVSKIFDGTVGITLAALGGSYGSLEEMLLTFSSAGYYGSLGIVATSPAADAAIEKAVVVADPAARAPLTLDALKEQMALYSIIPIFESTFYMVSRADLDGVEAKWAASGVPYLYKVKAAA